MLARVLGPILAAGRRARVKAWALGLRLRLRRLGVRTEIVLGPGVRFASPPVLDVDPHSAATRGGRLRLVVGPGVRLGRDLTLELRLGTENALTLGAATVVQSWCRIQLHGGSIETGESCHVRDLVQLKTKSTLLLGDRVVLARGAVVHATAGVAIGDDCGIGERTSLIDTDHTLDGSGGAYLQAPLLADPIVLGRGVAVGANCVILRGARLGDGAALAAGAVLSGEVPAGHLAGGVPARVLKDLRL
jgi:acetyltransferase-like isoleucine patch superfamily enzyme